MGCSACGSRPGKSSVPTVTSRSSGRTLYQVVLPSGAVAFQTNNVDLARKVRSNYSGARLEPDPDAVPDEAPTEEGPLLVPTGLTVGDTVTVGKRTAKVRAKTPPKTPDEDVPAVE